jgi:hypothetical protein
MFITSNKKKNRERTLKKKQRNKKDEMWGERNKKGTRKIN